MSDIRDLSRLGMVMQEVPANNRRYAMEGSVEEVTAQMVAAGFPEFVLNADGVRTIVEHLTRLMSERQDEVLLGDPYSPTKGLPAAARLPGILDMQR